MAAPTDQRAGSRPIAFVLDNAGKLGTPVTLQIRPEELTRTEPFRSSVHQSLGRSGGVSGWVDDFGLGLPTINISGNTGWRESAGTKMDGVAAFHELNNLVTVDYAQAKTDAINKGFDPQKVRLIFVDMLDDFVWPVHPTQFQLRRSKSRPLLFQYNISMQALSTVIESVPLELPMAGNPQNAVIVLDRTMKQLEGYSSDVADGDLGDALGGGLGGLLGDFIDTVNSALNTVTDLIKSGQGLATKLANQAIGFASNLASVGLNIFRTINAIRDLPTSLKAQVGRIAAAFNELVCIFANALKPQPVYEEYSGLYGASNCSSTTGGRPYSPYANLNVFELIASDNGNISVSSAARESIAAIQAADPVSAPMSESEMNRHIGIINAGVSKA